MFCANCGAPVGRSSSPSDAALSGIDALMKQPAAQSYWTKRLLAFVIDVIIVVIILVVAAALIAIPTLVLSGTAALTSLFAGVFPIAAGLIIFLYFIVAEVTRGATIGKQIFHLKVVGPSGGNPTFVQSLVRNLSKIYWILLLIDVVVGLATSKQYNQKFSDHLVGTTVAG